MPIRAEMKARYPKNWADIRARIQARAGNRCERCGCPNRQWVVRDRNDEFTWIAASSRRMAHSIRLAWQMAVRRVGQSISLREPVEIVCTTAHYPDFEPENCDDGNLQFLCQLHHFLVDAPLRELRRRERKQLVLIG